jgi:hypothetical protein
LPDAQHRFLTMTGYAQSESHFADRPVLESSSSALGLHNTITPLRAMCCNLFTSAWSRHFHKGSNRKERLAPKLAVASKKWVYRSFAAHHLTVSPHFGYLQASGHYPVFVVGSLTLLVSSTTRSLVCCVWRPTDRSIFC